jgi:hypothetical protein
MEQIYNYKENLIVNRVNTINKEFKKQVKYFKDITEKDRYMKEKERNLNSITIS